MNVLKEATESHIHCDICGGANVVLWTWACENDSPFIAPSLRGKRRFPVVRCVNCGFAFVSPRYSLEESRGIYADKRLFTGSSDPEGQLRSYIGERAEKIRYFQKVSQWMESHKSQGTLLDVGCGPGFFLSSLGKHWHSEGIDLSPYAVEYGRREFGLKLRHGEFAPGIYEAGSFDVVAMMQVFDHLPDPRQTLGEVRRILRNDGLLVMTSIVNGSSFCARVFAGGYRLIAPNHLYYFSPTNLKQLLSEFGFELEVIKFPYWNTPYCNLLEIINFAKKTAMAMASRLFGREPCIISPPFYGNHIDFMARKLP